MNTKELLRDKYLVSLPNLRIVQDDEGFESARVDVIAVPVFGGSNLQWNGVPTDKVIDVFGKVMYSRRATSLAEMLLTTEDLAALGDPTLLSRPGQELPN